MARSSGTRGVRNNPMFVVVEGEIAIVSGADQLVTVHRPGAFSGDVDLLSGRPTVVRAKAQGVTRVLELGQEHLRRLVQTDAELSEIFLRAFMLRRCALMARGYGNVVLIGSRHSAGTLAIQEFLTRNNQPYAYIDVDVDAEVQSDPRHLRRGRRRRSGLHLSRRAGPQEADHRRGGRVPRLEPGERGGSPRPRRDRGGSRPVSRPRSTRRPRASTSSSWSPAHPAARPARAPASRTISGSRRESRGSSWRATPSCRRRSSARSSSSRGRRCDMGCERRPYRVDIGGGHVGPGAHHHHRDGRPVPEARHSRTLRASKGWASTTAPPRSRRTSARGGRDRRGRRELGRSGRRLPVVVRATGQRRRPAPGARREHVALPHPADRGDAEHHRSALGCASRPSRGTPVSSASRGATERAGRTTVDIGHVFLMTGADPNTAWLGGCVAMDAKGFVKTGPELLPGDLAAAQWPLARPPLLFETTLPGSLRGRGRACGQRQARRGGGGRGLGLRSARAQGAGRLRPAARNSSATAAGLLPSRSTAAFMARMRSMSIVPSRAASAATHVRAAIAEASAHEHDGVVGRDRSAVVLERDQVVGRRCGRPRNRP